SGRNDALSYRRSGCVVGACGSVPHASMTVTDRSDDDLATATQDETPDLFGCHPGPGEHRTSPAARRAERRAAILTALEAPWDVWGALTPAARTARRYLTRHPERDRPDPAYDLLTDRQAAAEYHLEEAAIEAERDRP